MERVVKEETTGKPKWQKLGGGSLRIGKQIIKPGQIFEANPEDISPAFRNMVKPVSGDATFKAVKLAEAAPKDAPKEKDIVKLAYSLKPRGESKTWFDVVDAQDKPVNEKALQKGGAEKLLADLLK